jgi:hypothetical protein
MGVEGVNMVQQLVAVSLLIISAGALGADASATAPGVADFFVTGIFGRAEAGYVALIGYPDGKLARVRAGDRLGDALVEEVAAQWVRLRDAGAPAPRTVWLKGIRNEVAKTPQEAPGIPSAEGPKGGQPSAQTSPSGESSSEAQGQAAAGRVSQGSAEAEGKPESGPGKPLPGGQSLPQLGEQLGTLDRDALMRGSVDDLAGILAPMLGLPSDARVVGLESAPPNSLVQAVSYVARAAQRNEIVRLTVETGGERQRVMVFPASQEGDPARVQSFALGPQNPSPGAPASK